MKPYRCFGNAECPRRGQDAQARGHARSCLEQRITEIEADREIVNRQAMDGAVAKERLENLRKVVFKHLDAVEDETDQALTLRELSEFAGWYRIQPATTEPYWRKGEE